MIIDFHKGQGGGEYHLPTATANRLGGVKIGSGISVASDGTISAQGGGSGTTDYSQLENKPKINDVELTGNKSLSDLGIDIPTKVSDLENDLNFIDNTVNNLVNYYKKTETYTQAEVNALVQAIPHFSILVVNVLPATGDSATVYLVRNEESTGTDLYDEWIYVNNAWEHLGTAKVDMSQYYTKTETDGLLNAKTSKTYVDNEISRVENLIPSVEGLASEDYVDGAIADVKTEIEAEIPSLDGYATEQWVEGKGYLTQHQSLDGYATEEWVEDKGYLTQHQDITGKVDRSEIADMATKTWVEGKGYLTEHQSLAGYATEQWVEGKGYLTQHQDISGKANTSYVDSEIARVEGEIPSLDGYATETWVEGQGYLTEHQDISGKQDVLVSGTNIKTINGNSVLGSGNIVIDVTGSTPYAAGENIAISEDKIISVTGMTEAIEAATTDMATETWVEGQGYLTEHQSLAGYATETWVEGQGYLTEHQDISGKQDVLVSGTNIKTINGSSILGSGNIEIQGGGGNTEEIEQAVAAAFSDTRTEIQANLVNNYLTKSDVINRLNAKASKLELGGYYPKSDVDTQITNIYATIEDKELATSAAINDLNENKLNTSAIWSGTQAQWDALTPAQQSSYLIALVQ